LEVGKILLDSTLVVVGSTNIQQKKETVGDTREQGSAGGRCRRRKGMLSKRFLSQAVPSLKSPVDYREE